MGFPNVDKFLQRLVLAKLESLQDMPEETVADLFECLDAEEQAEICLYLTRLHPTKDIRYRDERKKVLYVLPHFPLAGHPFPQIGISVGTEGTADKILGSNTGNTRERRDAQGNLVGWKVEKGCLAHGGWQLDVIAHTKDETVWLSRICQLAITEALDELTALGVWDVSIEVGDVRPDEQATMQPAEIFVRTVRVSATVANTWYKDVPLSTYETGNNTAIH